MEDIERTSPNSARVEKTYEVSAETLAAAVERAAESLERWSVESSSESSIHAVRTTKLLRFKDDVKVAISASGDSCRAVFESASRVGKSDLGQNPKNLEELLEAVNRELGRTG